MMDDSELINKIDHISSELKKYLLTHLDDDGLIRGELSSSALSTAVSVFALFLHDKKKHAPKIEKGVLWLKNTVNTDNGWGDTPISRSNLSTTVLCISALASVCSPNDPIIGKAQIQVKKQVKVVSN